VIGLATHESRHGPLALDLEFPGRTLTTGGHRGNRKAVANLEDHSFVSTRRVTCSRSNTPAVDGILAADSGQVFERLIDFSASWPWVRLFSGGDMPGTLMKTRSSDNFTRDLSRNSKGHNFWARTLSTFRPASTSFKDVILVRCEKAFSMISSIPLLRPS